VTLRCVVCLMGLECVSNVTTATYCSHKCRDQAYRERAKARGLKAAPRTEEHKALRRVGDSPLDPDESPLVWDGVTTYAEERTYLFVRVCMLCGRQQQDIERLTKERARMLTLVGLPRCFVAACRGNVFIDEVEITGIGSPRLVAIRSWSAFG
jgi:hypothetical protein